MNKIILFLVLLMTASAANAGPFAALIPIVIGAVVKSVVLKLVLTLIATVAISALQRALQSKGRARAAGIQIERKLTGGVNSRTIILGTYATAGSDVTPAMSFGNEDDTPNYYLVHVIQLTDVVVDSLVGLIVNGEYVEINATPNYNDFHTVLGKYNGNMYIKFHDGSQTVADPWLIEKFGSYIRPWTDQHYGKGVSYAIIQTGYNTDLHKGEPEFKFVINGARLYDPRKDSTVGGSGSHRWGDITTYEFSENNIVQVYNILRGITYADGSKWGGECSASDLPLSNWVAGMNVCDETVTTADGTEPRYRSGYEILTAEDEPADIIDELLKGCSGSISETGGIYKVRVGPPSLPVMFITDDDILVSRDEEFNPFPGIKSSTNTIFAQYPSPAEAWNQHDAPSLNNDDYIAQDDGQILPASLQLPTTPFPLQVQRLMSGWLKDDRRWRQHTLTLGHYAFVLEPLDAISWTSTRNGYDDKVFEISSTQENLMTLEKLAGLREVDPADYDWTPDQQLPEQITVPQWDLPAVQGVPGLAVSAYSITDATSAARRPAVRAVWTALAAQDATALKLQVRLAASAAAVTELTVTNVTDGEAIISTGILPSTVYQVRGQYIVNRPTEWSSWLSVTTAAILLSNPDIDGYSQLLTDTATALANIASAEADITDLQGDAADLFGRVGDLEVAFDQLDLVASVGSNLLVNGGFENGLIGVNTFGLGVWGYTPSYAGQGPFVFNNNWSGGDSGIYIDFSDPGLSAITGQQFTLSFDATLYTTGGGNVRSQLQFFNGSTLITSYDGAYKPSNFDFSNDGQRRQDLKVTGTVPSGTTLIRSVAVISPNSGATVDGAAIRQMKLERGDKASAYTGEATSRLTLTAIADADTRVATLETLTTTQGASIATNATAISGLTGDLATLTNTVSAGAPNLLAYGSFAGGLKGWTQASGSWFALTSDPNWGPYIYITGTGSYYLSSDIQSCQPNQTYTISADIDRGGTTGGHVAVAVVFYTSSDMYISEIDASKPSGGNFSNDSRNRVKGTGFAPSNAVKMRVFCIVDGGPSNGTNSFRQIKLNAGTDAGLFTDAATVSETFKSLQTLDTQYSSLDTTVSTQGATITSNSTAITTLNGQMTASFARTAVTLDVNGHITGWEQNNNGTVGSFVINADYFSIVKPGGGASLTWITDSSNRGTLKVNDGTIDRVEIGYLT